MTVRKSLPGPGNPVFHFWAPYFRSELIDHPNAVFLAYVNVFRPNQQRPPGAPFLQPSQFSEETGFDGNSDQTSWNLWRKSIADLDDPDWEDCVKAHLRACARAAADCFEYCRYYKGTGSLGGGLYESGVSLLGLGTFYNSKATDQEWYDMARLYAHPCDGTSTDTPDTTTLLHDGDSWYLPSSSGYPNMGELNSALYTPWCEEGIAEVAPLVLYFAEQMKAQCDARNLCYPAQLVLDNEQNPVHWTVASGVEGTQYGNFNNVRADDRYDSSTVYEIKDGDTYVPQTYADHFASHGGALAAAVGSYYGGSYGTNELVHEMLWRLYAFAYDYAEHKAFYEPWKSVFSESRCSNYNNRFVPQESEKKILITNQGLEVACENVRADFSSPVLYPSTVFAEYYEETQDITNPYQVALATATDIVESCDKVNRDFRGWVWMPTQEQEGVNGIRWASDRFGRFIGLMDKSGGHSFYVFNNQPWNDCESDRLVVDAFNRALMYSNRSQRALDLINIGGGKRR